MRRTIIDVRSLYSKAKRPPVKIAPTGEQLAHQERQREKSRAKREKRHAAIREALVRAEVYGLMQTFTDPDD